MLKNYTIVLLVLVFLIESCSSGKQALERGDYYEAVMKSVNRLRKNSSHKKSSRSLKQAYPLAVEWLEEEANRTIETNDNFKWKKSLEFYTKINNMYESIRTSPGAKRIIPNPKNYYNKISELKEKAAKEYYDTGIAAMLKNTRDDAKKAYYHFLEAEKLVPDYEEVADMIVEAKTNATLKVIIEQIPVPTQYQLSAEFFQDNVEGFARSEDASGEFVKFFTPSEANNQPNLKIDQILSIKFDDFIVGQEFTRANTEKIEKDSVEVGTVTLDDGTKKPVLGTVTAKYTKYHKEVKSSGRVSMIVLDANSDAVLNHEKFDGQYVWVSEWGTYKGDERALSEKQLNICKRKEGYQPSKQDMFIQFTVPIYNQLTSSIQNFYKEY